MYATTPNKASNPPTMFTTFMPNVQEFPYCGNISELRHYIICSTHYPPCLTRAVGPMVVGV